MLNRNNLIVGVLLLLLLLNAGVINLPNVPVVPSAKKVDRTTYVHEKDDGPVPSPIMYALGELNKVGIIATAFEVDSVTGLDTVPTQDRIAVETAKTNGTPCLVVQAGEVVKVIVKAPTTVAHVAEAVGIEIKEPQ